jgi:hypothetical protein
VRCGRPLEDDSKRGGLPLVGTVQSAFPEASNRSRNLRRTCAASFPAELASLNGGRLLLLGEPDLLVDAILGRRIADVDQAHVSVDTRADVVG